MRVSSLQYRAAGPASDAVVRQVLRIGFAATDHNPYRTLTEIVLERPTAPFASVTLSLGLKLPVLL